MWDTSQNKIDGGARISRGDDNNVLGEFAGERADDKLQRMPIGFPPGTGYLAVATITIRAIMTAIMTHVRHDGVDEPH